LVVPSDEASLLVGYNIILKTESFQHSSFIWEGKIRLWLSLYLYVFFRS
jgi:hypothetical protein